MYHTISFRFMVVASKIGKNANAPLMLSIIVNKKRVSIQLKKNSCQKVRSLTPYFQ